MNRHKIAHKIFAAFVLAALFAGCFQKLPPDLPKLYPCEVQVLMKGEPLADAFVGFAPDEGKWSAMGTTDEKGTTMLKTNFQYEGVPQGSYKIIITKIIEKTTRIDASHADPDVEGSGRTVMEVSLLDDCFKTEKETPLSFTVEAKKKNAVVFEVW